MCRQCSSPPPNSTLFLHLFIHSTKGYPFTLTTGWAAAITYCHFVLRWTSFALLLIIDPCRQSHRHQSQRLLFNCIELFTTTATTTTFVWWVSLCCFVDARFRFGRGRQPTATTTTKQSSTNGENGQDVPGVFARVLPPHLLVRPLPCSFGQPRRTHLKGKSFIFFTINSSFY